MEKRRARLFQNLRRTNSKQKSICGIKLVEKVISSYIYIVSYSVPLNRAQRLRCRPRRSSAV